MCAISRMQSVHALWHLHGLEIAMQKENVKRPVVGVSSHDCIHDRCSSGGSTLSSCTTNDVCNYSDLVVLTLVTIIQARTNICNSFVGCLTIGRFINMFLVCKM